jgi:hypothetical protein
MLAHGVGRINDHGEIPEDIAVPYECLAEYFILQREAAMPGLFVSILI